MNAANLIKFHQVVATCALTLLLTGVTGFCFLRGYLGWIDFHAYDLFVNLSSQDQRVDDIVLVTMDQDSARKLNKPRGYWQRNQLAQALRHLCQAGAETIGLDIILASADLAGGADDDLATAIETCNNVVLGRISSTGDGLAVLAQDLFRDAMIGDGFIDLTPDTDGVLRRIPYLSAKPLADGELTLVPSFSLELVRVFLNLDFAFDFSNPDYIRMGPADTRPLDLVLPELIINYSGRPDIFESLSYADVVTDQFDADRVNGKLVILGSTLASQKDFFSTPHSRFSGRPDNYNRFFGEIIRRFTGKHAPGLLCHAFAAQTMLSRQFIFPASQPIIILTIGLGALLGLGFYFHPWGVVWGLSGLVVWLVGIVIASAQAFIHYRIWFEISPIGTILVLQFASGSFLQWVISRKKSAMMTALLGKYVSAGVAKQLIKGRLDATMAGRQQILTVLFSDLRGFTQLAESLGAAETGRLLNHYFDVMIPIVFKHDGTLDKLIGDAIMALFGAPVFYDDHPVKAAGAALEMIAAISRIQRSEIAGAAHIDAGIGIHSGMAIVGNMGSAQFMDYTAIGDTINLGARLEALNKFYGTHVIASQSTAAQLDARFVKRPLDRVRVRGRAEVVELYELMGFSNRLDDDKIRLSQIFEQGFLAYQRQDLRLARAKFTQGLACVPDDRPCQLYLDRLDHARMDGRDGVTIFDAPIHGVESLQSQLG